MERIKNTYSRDFRKYCLRLISLGYRLRFNSGDGSFNLPLPSSPPVSSYDSVSVYTLRFNDFVGEFSSVRKAYEYVIRDDVFKR